MDSLIRLRPLRFLASKRMRPPGLNAPSSVGLRKLATNNAARSLLSSTFISANLTQTDNNSRELRSLLLSLEMEQVGLLVGDTVLALGESDLLRVPSLLLVVGRLLLLLRHAIRVGTDLLVRLLVDALQLNPKN